MHGDSRGEDQLPPFPLLDNDEDREKKAEHRLPGTYHIVANPSSFESLEEHEDSIEGPGLGSRSKPDGCGEPRYSPVTASSSKKRLDVYADPQTLILGSFEENLRKMPSLGLLTTHFSSPTNSSLASLSSDSGRLPSPKSFLRSSATPPVLGHIIQTGADQEVVSFYNHFVRSQFNQVHRDSLGTSSQLGTSTTSEVLDQHAAVFAPVSPFNHCLFRIWIQN